MSAVFPNEFLYEFVTLFVVLNPIATLPVFITVTEGLGRRQSLLVALYAIGISFLVLMIFVVGGQNLLEVLRIPMASFQFGGSLVLLLFGLKMVLVRSAEDLMEKVTEDLLKELTEEAEGVGAGPSLLHRAIYPLAVPGIAGAGAMLTVVLLTDNEVRSIGEQVTTTGILVFCLAIHFVLFAMSASIVRALRQPGVEMVSRVFGLILVSIAVTSLVIAIKVTFGISP